jgi:small subunit ribosomal protein S17
MIGRVTSTKSAKTATVLLERTKRHPLYKKDFVSSKKYLVDDQLGVAVGDVVEFIKCRPVSKKKHWTITKVLGKDIVALGTEELKESASEAIAEVLPEAIEEEKVEAEEKDIKKGKE